MTCHDPNSDDSEWPEVELEESILYQPCRDPFWDAPEGNSLINRWIAGEATPEEAQLLEEAQAQDPALKHKVAVMWLLTLGLAPSDRDNPPVPPGSPPAP